MERQIKDTKCETEKDEKMKRREIETKRRDRIAYRPRKGLGFIDLSGRGDRRHINLSHFIYRLPRITSISSNQCLFSTSFCFRYIPCTTS